MDYKHRVPANSRFKRPKRPNYAGRWATAAALVAGLLAIWLFWPDGEGESAAPLPEVPHTVELPAPPMGVTGGKAEEKKRAEKPESKSGREAKRPVPEVKPEEAATETPKAPETRFKFYEILQAEEVVIPESELKTLKREEILGKKPEGTPYMLQAGSFANLDDAEKFKVQLAQLKVKSQVEAVKLDNKVWHRVKIGPFANVVDLVKVRAYLREHHIDSVPQQAKRH
jgi:cell division protein FtsN